MFMFMFMFLHIQKTKTTHADISSQTLDLSCQKFHTVFLYVCNIQMHGFTILPCGPDIAIGAPPRRHLLLMAWHVQENNLFATFTHSTTSLVSLLSKCCCFWYYLLILFLSHFFPLFFSPTCSLLQTFHSRIITHSTIYINKFIWL